MHVDDVVRWENAAALLLHDLDAAVPALRRTDAAVERIITCYYFGPLPMLSTIINLR